jgi:hypothetical protein
MLDKIKKILEFSSKIGFYLPAAYDSSRDQASTTLLSFYIGLFLTVLSLVAYHFMPDKLVGPTSMTLLFLGMTFVFYRIRSLDKVRIDFNDQELELDADNSEETNNNTKKEDE